MVTIDGDNCLRDFMVSYNGDLVGFDSDFKGFCGT